MTPSVISIEVQTEDKGEERMERGVERGVDTMSPSWKGDDHLPVIMEDDERNTRWRGNDEEREREGNALSITNTHSQSTICI